jgi:ATP synthase protein I
VNKLALKGLKLGFKVVGIQCVVVIIIALLGALIKDVESMLSIMVGGSAAIIPNVIFVLFVFSTAGASQMQTTMARFFRGATLKLVLSSVLLALAMKSGFLILFLFVGFIAAIFAHIFTPVSIT